MIRGGVGGANTNASGLPFEQELDLKEFIENNFPNYRVETYKAPMGKMQFGGKYKQIQQVFDEKGDELGLILSQGLLYEFLKSKNIDYKNIFSKKYKPDEAFLNIQKRALTIVEKKFQSTPGSVDEKLQTFEFKKWVYSKLIDKIDEIDYVRFIFVGNGSWFNHHRYKDVYDYFKERGIEYYFDALPETIFD